MSLQSALKKFRKNNLYQLQSEDCSNDTIEVHEPGKSSKSTIQLTNEAKEKGFLIQFQSNPFFNNRKEVIDSRPYNNNEMIYDVLIKEWYGESGSVFYILDKDPEIRKFQLELIMGDSEEKLPLGWKLVKATVNKEVNKYRVIDAHKKYNRTYAKKVEQLVKTAKDTALLFIDDERQGLISGGVSEKIRPEIYSAMSTVEAKQALKVREKSETTLFPVRNDGAWNYHSNLNNGFKSMILRRPDERPYLYYGIEIEVDLPSDENRNHMIRDVLAVGKGLFTAETDSTISNGYELVSRPLSYKMWTSPEIIKILEDVFKTLYSYGYCNTFRDNVGMHISLSKKFFEKGGKGYRNTVVDLSWIWTYGLDELMPLIGRRPTNYCESLKTAVKNRLDGRELSFMDVRLNKDKLDFDNIRFDRRQAINLTNEQRIEIRSFAVPETVLHLLASIDLCRSVAHFSREMKPEDANLEQIVFYKDSPFLSQFFKENKVQLSQDKIKNYMEV